jgi:hypothetical protein
VGSISQRAVLAHAVLVRVYFTRIAIAAWIATVAMHASLGAFDTLARLAPPGAIDRDDRVRIDAGEAFVDVLPAEGRDISVFGAVRTHADGRRLVAWVHDIERFQRGRYIPRLARFSEPPQLSDLETMVLDGRDLDDIRRCRPGHCGLKLTGAEIARLRSIPDLDRAAWVAAIQEEFRRLMLDRLVAYRAGGHEIMGVYGDRKRVENPGVEFDALAATPDLIPLAGPALAGYLSRYPADSTTDCESFFYWSQEELGTGKQITTITHVAILRSAERARPEVLVASKQVSATHYLTASLSLTAIANGAAGQKYLVYARRSRADLLDGPFSGLVRRVLERRIRAEAPAVLDRLRIRLESGDPPASSFTRSPDDASSPSPSVR